MLIYEHLNQWTGNLMFYCHFQPYPNLFLSLFTISFLTLTSISYMCSCFCQIDYGQIQPTMKEEEFPSSSEQPWAWFWKQCQFSMASWVVQFAVTKVLVWKLILCHEQRSGACPPLLLLLFRTLCPPMGSHPIQSPSHRQAPVSAPGNRGESFLTDFLGKGCFGGAWEGPGLVSCSSTRFPGWSGTVSVLHFQIRVIGIEYPPFVLPLWLQLPAVWAVEGGAQWRVFCSDLLKTIEHSWNSDHSPVPSTLSTGFLVWCSKCVWTLFHAWQSHLAKIAVLWPEVGLEDRQQTGWMLWQWVRPATYRAMYGKILTSTWGVRALWFLYQLCLPPSFIVYESG